MGERTSRFGQRLTLAVFFCSVLHADILLPSIISEHMVVQAGTPVRLWGWAQAGEEVSAHLGNGPVVKTMATGAGKWQMFLPAVAAGGPYTLSINSKTIRDVLAGDVWVASGQSNMAFQLERSDGAAAEIKAAAYPRIRFFKVANSTADEPRDNVIGRWEAMRPTNAGQYSAVAYYFAKSLHLEKKIPMAIVQTAWGGTNCQAWTRKEVLENDENLKDYVKRKANNEQNVASALWNAMVAPIHTYPIKGFIWYQGEANRRDEDAFLYRRLFTAMIEDWRTQWGQGELPFLWVLLAPFTAPSPSDLPLTRESQLETLKLVNVGFANTLGVGNATDIHPTNKKTVGERLANAARAVAYGSTKAPVSPVLRQITGEGPSIRMWFDNAGAGLKLTGDPETAFEIAGPDGQYVPAKAKVDGATVVVSADAVGEPQFVRYAYKDVAPDVLYSSAGVPAAPVRARLSIP